MSSYNISSFISLLRSGLIENNTQEATGRLLLDSVMTDEYIDIATTMITHLVKQNREVPDTIKKASARPEVITNAIHYFEDVVVPDLNPHLIDDICSKNINQLKSDSSVPQAKFDELASLYHKGEIGEFLAKSFLYAISRPNKKIESSAKVEDVALLLEVDNRCPRCNQPLTKEIKGQSIRKYEITEIDPKKGSTSYHNKIALCANCSAEHQTFDVEFSEELFDLKEEYVKHADFKREMDHVSLEEEIRDVLFKIVDISFDIKQADFKLNVVKIDKKIQAENTFLLNNLKDHVLRYYFFIEDLLSRANIFEDTALDIRKASRKIEKIYPDQNDVVYYLSDWIFKKTNLTKPAHRRASDIIVAFFVQNCEVFHEIPE